MYNQNAQVLQSQLVIKDSATAVTKTSGSLIVEGSLSSLDTYVTGHVSINNVKITPNLNDFVCEKQSILPSSNEEFVDITGFYFNDTVTRAFKSIIYVETTENSKNAWEINAVRKGSNDWTYQSSFTGDLVSSLDFAVVNKIVNGVSCAQIQYKSNIGITIRYTATTSAEIGVDSTIDLAVFKNKFGTSTNGNLIYATSPNTVEFSEELKYVSNTFTIGENTNVLMLNTESFTDFSSGGALTVMGDASIAKNLIVGEKIGINNTNPNYELDVNGTINCDGILVSDNSTVGGHLIPDIDVTYDLGSSDKRWRDIYLSGDTIYLGDSQIKVTGGAISLSDPLSINGDLKINGNAFNENSGISYTYDHIWTTRGSAENINKWQSVCWSPELGIFCAVSDTRTGNIVMTSPDGINWTSRTAAANNGWQSVCWAPELGIFCAVAWSGINRVMTSPNGINWSLQTSHDDVAWRHVCWSPELRLFCAVGHNGTNRIMTSPDGINWTKRISNGNQWISVCWSPELAIFCAVAFGGNNQRVMTSPDGINWTLRNTPSNGWHWIYWAPELGLFCAVAWSGDSQRVMTSPDGINWTSRQSAANNVWMSVCWSPELGIFCAVSNTGTNNRVMTSPDGITWTTRSSPNIVWESICWAAELGIFCAVGTNAIMTSSTSITNTGGKMAVIQKNRRLAIGHYSPQTELDVKGSIRATNQILAPSGNGATNTTIGVAGIGFYGDNNTGLFRPTADTLGMLTGGTERVIISSSGNIGIGTSTPLYPLDVNLDGRLVDFTSGSILTSSGSASATAGHTITIAAKGSIWAKDGVLASSDSRIKTNITDINDSEALEKIRLLEPKYYNYVDKYFKGDRTVMGFLAQQVSQHLPHAVSTQRDVIPNVYDTATVNIVTETITAEQETEENLYEIEGNVQPNVIQKLVLTLTTKTHDFTQGDVVRIYDDMDTPFDLNVINVLGNSGFEVEFNNNISNKTSVFVYGKFVDDFHVLDKNAIWTVSTAALQELDREVQSTNLDLDNKNEKLLNLVQRINRLISEQK